MPPGALVKEPRVTNGSDRIPVRSEVPTGNRARERPVLSVAEVYRLADAIEPQYRALVLLATFGNLRWGELAGLRRRNLDLDNQSVRVTETVYELGQLVKGKPKSEATVRKVTLPELIIADLRRHLEMYTALGPDGLVFVGAKGAQLRRSNFSKSKTWSRAPAKAGISDELHFHDLRHIGNTLTGEAGASLAEMMSRMVTPRRVPQGSTCTPARNVTGSSRPRSTSSPGRS